MENQPAKPVDLSKITTDQILWDLKLHGLSAWQEGYIRELATRLRAAEARAEAAETLIDDIRADIETLTKLLNTMNGELK